MSKSQSRRFRFFFTLSDSPKFCFHRPYVRSHTHCTTIFRLHYSSFGTKRFCKNLTSDSFQILAELSFGSNLGRSSRLEDDRGEPRGYKKWSQCLFEGDFFFLGFCFGFFYFLRGIFFFRVLRRVCFFRNF